MFSKCEINKRSIVIMLDNQGILLLKGYFESMTNCIRLICFVVKRSLMDFVMASFNRTEIRDKKGL